MGNPVLGQLRRLLEQPPEIGDGPSTASGAQNLPAGSYKPTPHSFDKPGAFPDQQVKQPLDPHSNEQVPQGAWFDKAPGLPESTFVAHFDGNNQPRPYRKKLHGEIKAEFLEGVQPVDGDSQTPIAFIFLGTSGSGKGLLFNNLPADEFVFVSPDVVATHIPEYQEALEARARNAAKIVEEEAIWLTKLILREAVASKRNLAVDGCGRHSMGYLKLVKALGNQKYHVRPTLLYTSLDKAIERVRKRGEQTGRWAAEEPIRTALMHIPDTFLKLVKKTPAFELYNALTLPPKLAWEESEGQEKVNDEQFVRRFLETHESWESAMKRIFGPKLFAAYEQMSSNTSPVQAPTFPDRSAAPTRSEGRPLAVDMNDVHQAMEQGAKADHAKMRTLTSVFKTDQGVLLPDPEWLSEF